MASATDITNKIIIKIRGTTFNKVFQKKYSSISELSSILSFIKRIESEIPNINYLQISYSVLYEQLIIIKSELYIKKITTSAFFKNYCNHHKNKILINNKKCNNKLIFNIVISNYEQFKNADPHMYLNIRDNYYEDRTVLADP